MTYGLTPLGSSARCVYHIYSPLSWPYCPSACYRFGFRLFTPCPIDRSLTLSKAIVILKLASLYVGHYCITCHQAIEIFKLASLYIDLCCDKHYQVLIVILASGVLLER